ncbi:unnamed protein product [Xylocopa violacea]|uniref:Spondin-1 n=1 Tax=Xylocopa violacea TaxID=135666 RepID=A0ABP1NEF4_XYLVO
MIIKSLRNIRGFLLLLAAVTSTSASKCSRVIDGTTMPRSNAEGKYHLFITLFNRTEMVFSYMPNTRYSVNVEADSMGMIPRKFTRFLITAEPESEDDEAESGVFDLQDGTLMRYSENCPNAVVETTKMPKEEITVAWTSPSEGSGCIFIRATILETPDTWFMDDPNLTQKICQDSKVEADDQGQVLSQCYACEEAKYEVTFEGLWSRNTHPKDFPSKGWLIRFSDVIGASHTVDYRFWQYNGLASSGLRQVAELGSTRKLESELKNQSEHIRTIIKARGISYPNVTGKTFAVFRVDRKHHLMSLVSMIDPSPDWIVGVSGLELCQADRTWIEHKELNLYPYDAGTDSGITYLSPDSPTEPQEPIHRITSTYPNDSRSPFYDPSGLDMKPLARLYLNRQRLYEKACEAEPPDAADSGAGKAGSSNKPSKACRVTPWGPWSDCSVTCGRGNQLRQRYFRDGSASQEICNVSLSDRRPCYGKDPHCNGDRNSAILETEACALEEWSSWSSCTTTCGPGQTTRSRNFKDKKRRKECKIIQGGPELQQTIKCDNEPCPDEDSEEVREPSSQDEEADQNIQQSSGKEDYEEEEPVSEVTEAWLQKCPEDRFEPWSLWTPCSSTCGPGLRLRSRFVKKDWDADKDLSLEECKMEQAACVANIPTCDFTKEEAEKICSEPVKKGRCNGNILRTYFDKQSARCRWFRYSGCDANRNNFPTEEDCRKICGDFQKKLEFKGIQPDSQVMESPDTTENVDCQVSKWSAWTKCVKCSGYTTSEREITVQPRGNGKQCPSKLRRKRKCRKMPPCTMQGDAPGRRINRDRNSQTEEDQISVDCKMAQWSSWSPCTVTCGESSQYRTRTIKIEPVGPRARLCPPLVEYRNCHTIECP